MVSRIRESDVHRVTDELDGGDAQLALFQDLPGEGRYWARTSDPQLVEEDQEADETS